MGYDDGACDASVDGRHQLVLDAVTRGGRGGVAMVRRCQACGIEAYEASAGDDPARPPL